MAKRKPTEDQAEGDGFTAAGNGIGIHANPYPPGALREAWSRGWNSHKPGEQQQSDVPMSEDEGLSDV